jgi:hypothetical protein
MLFGVALSTNSFHEAKPMNPYKSNGNPGDDKVKIDLFVMSKCPGKTPSQNKT